MPMLMLTQTVRNSEMMTPSGEPYFGSKLVRARQEYALKAHFMNADARASEDLGLLMASNGNAVPSVFWFIYESLKSNSSVRGSLSGEVAASTNHNGELDIQKLIRQPLLQSMYAEVLRLYVGIGTARQSDSEPFQLGGYQIPKREPFIIFSRHPALNSEAWGAAERARAETAPLDEFYPERFLVPKTKDESGSSEETGFDFSLEGLAGLWLPYGGGQRMCPGRHFAKNEIIGTFALLTREYDMELTGSARHQHTKPDLRWFPSGALPPVGKVPFRIRKRVHSTPRGL
ncbi:cytochrome P450 monooxygenase [Apiospora kogelbergensis]|uniref:cytochrome P450 monooxygenase n=1 Tax=Apiospora kogelbergensis TaxID=1337665 RepID=UPI003130F78A